MKPSKIERDLRYVKVNSPTPQELGNVDIRRLLSLGLVKRTNSTQVNYHIPQGAPRWAAKYKFTRKKYSVSESSEDNKQYMLTEKGKRRLKNLAMKRMKSNTKKEEEKEDKKRGKKIQK
jgi:hypothetical protein